MLLSLLSWLRPQTPRQRPARRPTSFKPMLESLDERIVPSPVGNPHFINSATSAGLNSAGDLVVTFKEAGLPNGQVENITLSATESATYGFINGGGNHPKASNKETEVSSVSSTGQFTVQNGSVSGTLTLNVLPPPSNLFPVPQGQTLELFSVSYTGVSLKDTTSGATANIPGTFSETFFKL